jgi:hypothetical protein
MGKGQSGVAFDGMTLHLKEIFKGLGKALEKTAIVKMAIANEPVREAVSMQGKAVGIVTVDEALQARHRAKEDMLSVGQEENLARIVEMKVEAKIADKGVGRMINVAAQEIDFQMSVLRKDKVEAVVAALAVLAEIPGHHGAMRQDR